MITVTGVAKSPYTSTATGAEKTDTTSINIEIKDPCIDTNFVTITNAPLPMLEYIVFAPAETFAPHPEFTVSTSPYPHTLCGGIVYKGQYMGADLAANGPLTYDPATREFTADSEDSSLIGMVKTYGVVAELANYPTATTNGPSASSSNNIEFNDPCLDPFDFSTNPQGSISDNYSGVEQRLEIVPFTIEPSLCKVRYTCTSVTRVDGNPSDIDCSDLNIDGEFDTVGDDGTIKFTASNSDYLNQAYAPGVYEITIQGLAIKAVDMDTLTETVTLTLTDPCNPPASVTPPSSPGLENQQLIITETGKQYTHPEFVVSPDFCPLTYSYRVGVTEDGVDAVTGRTDRTFDFALSTPVSDYSTEKQLIQITATSTSIYNNVAPINQVPDTRDATDSFELSFVDPCGLPNFVSFTSTTTGTNTLTDSYSSSSLTFGPVSVVTDPSFCAVTIKCASVSTNDGQSGYLSCQELDASNQLELSFGETEYNDNPTSLLPGTYTFTFDYFTGPDPNTDANLKD